MKMQIEENEIDEDEKDEILEHFSGKGPQTQTSNITHHIRS